jgi:cell division protein FtsQ
LNRKKTIRKAIIIGACVLAGGGMATLLVAANRKEKTHYCKRIDITVNGSGEKLYISKSDILSQLQHAAKGTIINKGIETIDVALLEKTLEQHAWIRDAELYFDTRDVLHVTVAEREPVARVFTTAGTTFYMDTAGQRLPLLPDVVVRVPVVTAFTASKMLSKKDSAIAKDVAAIAQYITTHPFWSAQVAQIDITPAGTFELLPVVGNHIIRIGRAENIDEKLSNLLLFYKQVLSKTGFDKYAVVDVQYKDEVIGSHERTVSAIDSVQLQRNIQELMRKVKQQAEADSIAVVEQAKEAKEDSLQKATPTLSALNEKPTTVKAQPKTVANTKSNLVKNTNSNIKKKPAKQKPRPKAVMKKPGA